MINLSEVGILHLLRLNRCAVRGLLLDRHSLVVDVFVVGLRQSEFEHIFLKSNCPEQVRVRKHLFHGRDGTAIFPQEVFTESLNDNRHLQNLLSIWSRMWLHLQEHLYQLSHIHRVVAWYRRVLPFKNFLEKAIHIISSKWGHQCAHLINHAAKAPNVRFQVVGLIFPHLW